MARHFHSEYINVTLYELFMPYSLHAYIYVWQHLCFRNILIRNVLYVTETIMLFFYHNSFFVMFGDIAFFGVSSRDY